jgi:hypothetical protein
MKSLFCGFAALLCLTAVANAQCVNGRCTSSVQVSYVYAPTAGSSVVVGADGKVYTVVASTVDKGNCCSSAATAGSSCSSQTTRRGLFSRFRGRCR